MIGSLSRVAGQVQVQVKIVVFMFLREAVKNYLADFIR